MVSYTLFPVFDVPITDAQWRLWCGTICNLLEAAGQLLVPDSGDGDPTTATWPAVNTTVSFYQIRRFSDTLQGSKPVYYKLEFMRGGGTAHPMIAITVGTGSDGVGNITGTFISRITHAMGGTAAVLYPFVISADTNRFLISFSTATLNFSALLSLERTKDISGDDTDEGVYLVSRTATTGVNGWGNGTRVGLFSTGTNYSETSPPVLGPFNQSSGLQPDGTVNVTPCFMFGPYGKPMPHCISLIGGMDLDFPSFQISPVEVYPGVVKNYFYVTSAYMNPNRGGGGLGNTMGCLLIAE